MPYHTGAKMKDDKKKSSSMSKSEKEEMEKKHGKKHVALMIIFMKSGDSKAKAHKRAMEAEKKNKKK
jgi:hypothetical protein